VRKNGQADAVERGARPGVEEKEDGGDRQNPPDRAAGRFEHEENRGRPEHEIDRRRLGGAVDQRTEVEDGPRERDHRGAREHPVEW
jgi:hypothetical protein